MTRATISGSQLSVKITDSSSVGESRRTARQLAEGFGFDDTQVGRICIIATEIAANILKHAAGGTVLLQVLDDGFQPSSKCWASTQDRGWLTSIYAGETVTLPAEPRAPEWALCPDYPRPSICLRPWTEARWCCRE